MTSRLAIGISVGPNEFAAAWGASHWETTLPNGPTLGDITDAAAKLKSSIGAKRRVSVSVAMLPPLARVRRITLPRMSTNDVRLAVETNVQQFFVGVGERVLCGTAVLRGTRRQATVSVLVCAVNAEVIENVIRGLTAPGWKIDRFVPAHVAWHSAVVLRNPRLVKGRGSIGVRLPGETNVLELESGSLVHVRRYPVSNGFPPIDPTRGRYVVGEGSGRTPAVVAAEGAAVSRRLEMVPEAMRRTRTMRGRRISLLLATVACLNLAGAATTYRWRLERQLSAVVDRRAAIRPRALRALALRDSTQSLLERTQSIARLEQSAPRWSAVLSRIAIALPGDAELSAIRAEGDSLALEGQSSDAARVVSALRRTSGLSATKMSAPIVREPTADDMSIERWRLAVRVDHHAAVQQR